MAVSSVTAFVSVIVLIIISAPWPGVLWHGQLSDSQLLIGTLGALSGLMAPMALRGKTIIAAMVAFLLAFGIFGVVQGRAYWEATNPGRQARAEAAKWPLLLSEEYTKRVSIPTAADQGGEVSVTIQDGRLVLAVNSDRDFTGQVPPAPQRPALEQRVVHDFYVQADVELTEGPQDAFCGLLFGWKGNEHWYAMKVGRLGLQVEQDLGTAPHTRLFGTVRPPALKTSSPNQLGILAHNGEVRFYVNDRQVSLLHVRDTTGQILVAAGAENNPDVLRCSFGHMRLWAT
jgi:hypothetical protein